MKLCREVFLKKERLKKGDEFKRIFKYGRKYRSKNFNLIVLPNKEGNARLGIVVSKKTAIAVRRNKIKRIIREIFRRNKLLFYPWEDYLFIIKNGAIELKYNEIFEELSYLLKISLKRN
jgi:ribonuclease P protein component